MAISLPFSSSSLSHKKPNTTTFTLTASLFLFSFILFLILILTTDLFSSTLNALLPLPPPPPPFNVETESSSVSQTILHENGEHGQSPKSDFASVMGSDPKGDDFMGSDENVDNGQSPKSDFSSVLRADPKGVEFRVSDENGENGEAPKSEFSSVLVGDPKGAEFKVSDEDLNHGQAPVSDISSVVGPGEEDDEARVRNGDRENHVEISIDSGNGDVGMVNEVKWDGKGCDLYTGKWVRDDDYPVYRSGSCPYVDEAFDCQSNGRPDSEYMQWRWKPDGCDLPRFNAIDFLHRLRGKRLMLVGDSMNRNQFESMLCLLHQGLRDKSKMFEMHGYKITKGRGYYVFKFEDYNCTVEFVRSHFLVREGVRINGQGNSNPTLSIDRIDKTAARWKKADILIFNTGHWWTHGKTARGKNYYKEGDHIYLRFDSAEAYRRALTTWGKWIDDNVESGKKLVFYRAYSSAHFRGGDWDSGGTCNGEQEPISGGAFLDTYPLKMKIVEEVIQQMKVPVILLNVTRLTNYRKDGHPSVYGKNRTAGIKVSGRRQDCSHWCLPGVPDAWNELIYATLVSRQNSQIL